MMNDKEKDRDVVCAGQELAACEKRLDEEGGRVVLAENLYDRFQSDENFGLLEKTLASQRRAHLDMTRAERRLKEAEQAFEQALLSEHRTELEQKKYALMPEQRRATYDADLPGIVPHVKALDVGVEALVISNIRLIETWDRARYLAHLIGDETFLARFPRPSPSEATSLLRLIMASQASGTCAEFLVPWTRPAWNGEGVDLYERAQELLAPEEKYE